VFSHFFINRPIFASVMSIIITIAGLVSVRTLPVAQYPQITPPSIIVQCNYPGASAKVVAESIAAPLEQQVNGVEDMIYMSSQSGNDGSYSLSVTFRPGVDLNFAQVLVQNRVNLALPLLPDVVKQTGVTTRKRNPDILQIVNLYSPNGRYNQLYLSNFATIQVRDELLRVDGVGDVFIFGQQDYSMRLWVDPDRLASLNLTAGDVVNAVREQNKQVAGGRIGQPPSLNGQTFVFPLSTLGRLTEPEEFEEIVLRTSADGRKVRLKDVGRAVLGARNEDVTSKLDGRPCTSLAVFQLPYANAIETADRVHDKMEALKKNFPEDIEYAIPYDTTPFVRESISGVYRTLAEAIVLVAFVVLVFLQNWRSTLIPLTAVPVAIIGTFAVMAAIGFSLNNLTLFGLVLAIGIVVDDAIVVVEAVEHHIEEGMKPRQAAYKAMEEVSGPVVAVALVLSAVFVPCAFISGITGQFFRQFALTIAVSTVISAFNSLTVSPALAALLLKPRGARKDILGRTLDFLFGWFFRSFNWAFRHTTGVYTRIVGLALRGSAIVLVVYGGLLVLTWWNFTRLPTGYIPNQDQRKLYAAIQLPDSASLERTQEIADRLAEIVAKTPGCAHNITVAGQSFVLSANGSNFGNLFITLDDFGKEPGPWYSINQKTLDALPTHGIPAEVIAKLKEKLKDEEYREKEDFLPDLRNVLDEQERSQYEATILKFATQDPRRTATEVADALNRKALKQIPEAMIKILGPPPVSGLGSTGGFKFIVEDRSGDNDLEKLEKQTYGLIAAGNADRYKVSSKTVGILRDAGMSEEGVAEHKSMADIGFSGRDLDQNLAKHIPDKEERKKVRERLLGSDGKSGEAERQSKQVTGLFTVFRANSPQLYVDLNRSQCETMGVNPNDVFTTLQVYLGSYYVNDFNKFGRTWQVVVQAEGSFRDDLDKVRNLKVRNVDGNMVPLGSVLTVQQISGPILLMRYNMYPAAAIVGGTAPDVSSGQGIDAMQRLARHNLPQSMGYEWTEINWIQIDASKNIWNNLIFPLACVFVFLVLAAQYESWALPLAVILVVPMCILGSLIGVIVTHSDINIFTQIGFVVLVGLASKNAILIVEFAKHKHESGQSRREATLEACQLRLRPILMTSFAFILGVVPLMTASGAGAEMRRTLGTAVFSGMLGVTLFGIFLTPVFFYVIESVVETPLFSSARMRLVGTILLWIVGILGLGIPWLLILLLGRATRRPVRRPRTSSTREALPKGNRALDHADGHKKNGHPTGGDTERILKN
jgi:multidrug efflux pump